MAELVDALVLETNAAGVRVQVSLGAPYGPVPKWLREQSATLLFVGSNPTRSSNLTFIKIFDIILLESEKNMRRITMIMTSTISESGDSFVMLSISGK